MADKILSRPPYPSTGQADAILDIFRRVSPKKIDSKFVAENEIATAPNASNVVNFLKYLGIIDSENNVKDEVANKLRLIGAERDKYIAELIKKAYKDIFEGVNLQQARREDLINFFIHAYNYGTAPAKNSSLLFLHLCEKYGIPISDELRKKTHTGVTGTNRIEKKTVQSRSKIEKSFSVKPEQDNEQKVGVIILSIRGNGLNKQVEAKNANELQKLYEGKFKEFIEAGKHLFDDEELTTEEKTEDL
jgi:hypothetical protein